MSMYDLVYLVMECPYCKRKSEIEFEVKKLAGIFEVHRKGDKIRVECMPLEYLEGHGECNSPECQGKSDKHSIIKGASFLPHFGLFFGAKIKLDKGVITGEIFDIKIDENIHKYIDENKDKWEKIYKPREKGDRVLKKFKEIK